MKEGVKAYFNFNRTERLGIVALVSLLIVLVAVKATLHLWVKPDIDTGKEQQLRTAWEQFKSQQPMDTSKQKFLPQLPTQKQVDVNKEEAVLFEFDPNTVDSAALRKLGLREKTTSIFLHWRAKGKKFYKKEEFRKVYTLTEQEYKRLEPYIVIH
jgi:competence protein ComEA